jgi:hypothetical protein
MISLKYIILLLKSKGVPPMDREDREELRDIAGKLEAMRRTAPEEFCYVKGFIHCLAAKNRLAAENGPARPAGGPRRKRASGVRLT